jgi:hypothetical protein
MPYLAILGGIGAATWVRVISQHKDIVLPGLMLCSVVTLHGIVLARLDLTGEYTHEETLAKLRYIVDRTDTSAAVMSSWSPGVTFRKPAFFYPALNPEIRSVIPKEAYEKLVNEIRNKTTVPEIVDMDTDMEQMPPELLALLKNKWEPVGVATLWRHRHD